MGKLRNEKLTGFSGLQLNPASEIVNSVTVTPYLVDTNGDILFATGTTVPTNDSAGFAKGCLFVDTDVAKGTTGLYCNKGTNAECTFTAVTQA